MDTLDWIVVPRRGRPQELSESESYPRLIELMQDIDAERGHLLDDRQANALQTIILNLIGAGARITYYDDE